MAGNMDQESPSSTTSPIGLPCLPWKTNWQCVDTLNNEDKKEALEQYCARLGLCGRGQAEAFLRVIFDKDFRMYTRAKGRPLRGQVSKDHQCGMWFLGKPIFDLYVKVHSAFVDVMNLRRNPVDPPFSEQDLKHLADKIDSAADSYSKRVGRPFLMGTALLWYKELASGSCARDSALADGLALLLFDYAQKTFLLDDEYPLDDDGYPLRVEETRDYVAKWLPLFALRWMEMDQKPGKGNAPKVSASTLPNSFVFWQPRKEWKENPETGQEDPIGSPLGKYMEGRDAYSRRFHTELGAAATHGKLMIEDYIHHHKEDLQQRLEERQMRDRDTDKEDFGE